jgi:hypothetical protein
VLEVPEISGRLEVTAKIRLTRVENSYYRGTPAEPLAEAPAGKSRRRPRKSPAERAASQAPPAEQREPLPEEMPPVRSWVDEALEAAETEPEPAPLEERPEGGEAGPSRRRRHRGGRRRGRKDASAEGAPPTVGEEEAEAPRAVEAPAHEAYFSRSASAPAAPAEGAAAEAAPGPPLTPTDAGYGMVPGYVPPKKRHRRGGRGRGGRPALETAAEAVAETAAAPPAPAPEPAPEPAPAEPPAPAPRRRGGRRKAAAPVVEAPPVPAPAPAPVTAEPPAEPAPPRPSRRRAPKKPAAEPAPAPAAPAPPAPPEPEKKPRRRRAPKQTEETPPEA